MIYLPYKILAEEKTDEDDALITIEVQKGFETFVEIIQASEAAIKNRDKDRKKAIAKIIKEHLERLECVEVKIITEEEL